MLTSTNKNQAIVLVRFKDRVMADFCTELCFDEAPGFAMLMPSHGVVKVLQR